MINGHLIFSTIHIKQYLYSIIKCIVRSKLECFPLCLSSTCFVAYLLTNCNRIWFWRYRFRWRRWRTRFVILSYIKYWCKVCKCNTSYATTSSYSTTHIWTYISRCRFSRRYRRCYWISNHSRWISDNCWVTRCNCSTRTFNRTSCYKWRCIWHWAYHTWISFRLPTHVLSHYAWEYCTISWRCCDTKVVIVRRRVLHIFCSIINLRCTLLSWTKSILPYSTSKLSYCCVEQSAHCSSAHLSATTKQWNT